MPRNFGLPPDISPNGVDVAWPFPAKIIVGVVVLITLLGIFVF